MLLLQPAVGHVRRVGDSLIQIFPRLALAVRVLLEPLPTPALIRLVLVPKLVPTTTYLHGLAEILSGGLRTTLQLGINATRDELLIIRLLLLSQATLLLLVVDLEVRWPSLIRLLELGTD